MLWRMLIFSLFLPVVPPHPPPFCISRRCTQPCSHHHLLLAVRSVSPGPGEVCIRPVHILRAQRPGWESRGVPLHAGAHTEPPAPLAASSPAVGSVLGTTQRTLQEPLQSSGRLPALQCSVLNLQLPAFHPGGPLSPEQALPPCTAARRALRAVSRDSGGLAAFPRFLSDRTLSCCLFSSI